MYFSLYLYTLNCKHKRGLWKLLDSYFKNNDCCSHYKSCALLIENLECTKCVKKVISGPTITNMLMCFLLDFQ